MRKTVGILILLAGWTTLGLIGSGNILPDWGFDKNAITIEAKIATDAQAQIGSTVYDVQTSVSGRDILVSGIVTSEAERSTILASLDSTRGRRVVIDDLRQIKIASPYIFRASKDAQRIVYEGNAPARSTFIEVIDPADVTLTLAGGMPSSDWPKFVETGVQGISILENGSFEISDRSIIVSGLAKSLEQAEEVRKVFSSLPEGYTAQVDLAVAPTVPYVFSGNKDGDAEYYAGFVPSVEARDVFTDLIGAAAQGLKPTAGLPDEKWLSVVGVGINALKGLNAGTLKIVDKRVEVVGSVNTPDAITNIEGLFAALPKGYTANVVLSSVDDGTPAALTFDWSAQNGGTINGKGAEGMVMDDLTAALKLPSLGGIFREGNVTGIDVMMAQLNAVGDVLPLLESVNATIEPANATVNGVLLPGGDMETALAVLENTFGNTTSVALVRSQLEPKEGDHRVNADTGKEEFFQRGFWKVVSPPTSNVSATGITSVQKPKPIERVGAAGPKITNPETCVAQTNTFMDTAKIIYETSSATLTAQSETALGNLFEIIQRCVEAGGLTVQVGGHTDSQGSEEFNLKLSQQRADSVLNSLIELGLSQGVISAKGFGEAQPIATNDTKEGRAQNRRTTITWLEQ
jgi:OOP family OmpA-OmpF porin